MPQKQEKSAVQRVGGAIARTARNLVTKLDPRKASRVAAAATKTTAKAAKPKAAKSTAAKAKTAKPKAAVKTKSAAKANAKTSSAKPKSAPAPARVTRRESDVPMDVLTADSYAPSQTSIKTSFRSNGADHQNDQEIPLGAGERFENEDHFTNKSGDARIGTHGRTYEPGEPFKSASNATRR